MTLGPFTSRAIWSAAENPDGPIKWLLVWLGRTLILVFACALAIVTLGATWRWPFVMAGRWYWFDYQVRQVRRELRLARKTAASEWEAVKLTEAALVRRGLMAATREQAEPELNALAKPELINYIVNGGTKPVEQQNAEFLTSAAFWAADPATRPLIGGKTLLEATMTDEDLTKFVNDYRVWAIKNGHCPPDSVEHFRTIRKQRNYLLKSLGK